jgi:cerevisin
MMHVVDRVLLVIAYTLTLAKQLAYVIDTGVNIKHEQFEGRAVWGATIPTGDEDEDGNGHGTHVAGTIGSKTYGVAKKAKIVAVKVLRSNGSGTMSDVLKGVEWAAEAMEKEEEIEKKKGKKSTYKVYHLYARV